MTEENRETDGNGVNDSEGAPSGTAEAVSGTVETPTVLDPLDEARSEAAKMKESWMRSAADFDNFRKRSRKEAEDARKAGREDVLRELLPVFDNLERAISSSQAATDVKGVVDGLNMILKQFEASLGRAGVVKLKSIGLPFDPTVHEAIQQIETDEHAPGTVVSEIQSGYTQGERLVRAAMVVVAKPKSS